MLICRRRLIQELGILIKAELFGNPHDPDMLLTFDESGAVRKHHRKVSSTTGDVTCSRDSTIDSVSQSNFLQGDVPTSSRRWRRRIGCPHSIVSPRMGMMTCAFFVSKTEPKWRSRWSSPDEVLRPVSISWPAKRTRNVAGAMLRQVWQRSQAVMFRVGAGAHCGVSLSHDIYVRLLPARLRDDRQRRYPRVQNALFFFPFSLLSSSFPQAWSLQPVNARAKV